MGYLTTIIALGIIVLFGSWSVWRRTKSQKSKKPKVPEVYRLSKSKRQTKLRRVK
jgi:ABC-type nickel/cobalt efflux system permease component RcnA